MQKAATTVKQLIEQLADVGRMAVDMGLVLASGGNLSARLPGTSEFVITGAGTWLDRLTPDDFATMNLAGDILDGVSPSSEWKLHQRTYLVRDDVNSVVHLHPQSTVLVDALGHKIRLFSLDHAYYVKSIGRTDFYPNASDELADTAAEQAKQHNCVVMGHHGCSALGQDVGMAFRRAANLEQAAAATYRALAVGDTTTSFPEGARLTLQHA